MKDPKWILREVKTHLALVKYERKRIEERGVSPNLLEDRVFLILLDHVGKVWGDTVRRVLEKATQIEE